MRDVLALPSGSNSVLSYLLFNASRWRWDWWEVPSESSTLTHLRHENKVLSAAGVFFFSFFFGSTLEKVSEEPHIASCFWMGLFAHRVTRRTSEVYFQNLCANDVACLEQLVQSELTNTNTHTHTNTSTHSHWFFISFHHFPYSFMLHSGLSGLSPIMWLGLFRHK